VREGEDRLVPLDELIDGCCFGCCHCGLCLEVEKEFLSMD
jgi:hypothetical protein